MIANCSYLDKIFPASHYPRRNEAPRSKPQGIKAELRRSQTTETGSEKKNWGQVFILDKKKNRGQVFILDIFRLMGYKDPNHLQQMG